MKLRSLPLFISLIAASPVVWAEDRSIIPSRVTFDALGGADYDSLLVKALNADGFVSVTNIPGFRETKLKLMSHLTRCMMDLGEETVTVHHFDDGTTRRSFATSTLPSIGAQPITTLEGVDLSEACQLFQRELSSFRSSVEMTTKLFSEKLSTEMGPYLQTPLMSSNVDGLVYDSITEVVAGGEHLEHFHSYQKENSLGDAAGETTIELHTDQGFFIAFTPGLIASPLDPTKQLKLSDGFYVQDRHGEKASVKFSDEDDLVFMTGDGINQYINNNFVDSMDAKSLRATPHALSFPALDSSDVRVWYGLMVLPPNNALLQNSDLTHGEVRKSLMDGNDFSLGCSSPEMKAVIHTSRHLSGPSEILNCTSDELFCWFRCQPLDDDLKTCADRNLTLECVDSQGQITDPAQHNGASPACYNSTAPLSSENGVNWQGDYYDDHSHAEDGGHSHGHGHGDDGHHMDMGTQTASSGSRNTVTSVSAWLLIASITISKVVTVI